MTDAEEQQSARCPNCDQPGAIGEPCSHPPCARHRTHRIPGPFLAYSPADAEGRAQLGRMIGGRYLVVGVLGKGSFGRVLHVLQRPLWRPAALKLMELSGAARDEAQRFVEQFRREAESLAMLDHENIVRLLDYDDDDGEGSAYMVMELIAGKRTLRTEMRERQRAGKPFTAQEVEQWTGQMLAGLAVAHGHAKCIVHRDLKPDNVMLVPASDGKLSVKIVDFGLAKFTAESDRTRGAVGTLRYMAPEQLRAAEIGPAADIYAVACIALELITGTPMFSFRNEAQTIAAKRDPDFDPVAALDLPPHAELLFRSALCFDPKGRTADAATFRREFTALIRSLDRDDPSPAQPAVRPSSAQSSASDASAATDVGATDGWPKHASTKPAKAPSTAVVGKDKSARTAPSAIDAPTGRAIANPVELAATQAWALSVALVVLAGLIASGH